MRRPTMRAAWWAVLWCLATSMSTSWAVEPLAGPWVVLHPDGSQVVAIELPEAAGTSGRDVVLEARDGSQARVARRRAVERSFSRTTWIAAVRVEADAPRAWRMRWGERAAVAIDLQPPPRHSAAAWVVIATAASYPTRQDIATITTELDGPPEVVVLVGDGAARNLGRGGWEADIPIAVVPPLGADDRVLDVVAGEGARWSNGLRWGRLGLPAAQGDDRAAAGDHLGKTLARDLSPWQIALDPHGRWRLDRPSDEHAPPVILIEMARRRRLPLVVSATPSAGFLSDPLSLAMDRELLSMPGGTRWLGLSNGASDVAGIPRQALALHPQPAMVAVHADREMRVVVMAHAGEVHARLVYVPWPDPGIPPLSVDAPARLPQELDAWYRSAQGDEQARAASWWPVETMQEWREEGGTLRRLKETLLEDAALALELDARLQRRYPWPRGGLSHGSGWGVGDVTALRETWVEGDADADESLRWLSTPELRRAMREGLSIETVFARYREGGGAEALLQRLALLEPDTVLAWVAHDHELPPLVARDALLRQFDLGADRVSQRLIAGVLQAVDDPLLMRAVLTRVEADPEPVLLDVLVDHWQQIDSGDASLPDDPILQHRLSTAVFDSPYLSPTPLRPLAVELLERVHPGARGPMERFLERHGETRPVHR